MTGCDAAIKSCYAKRGCYERMRSGDVRMRSGDVIYHRISPEYISKLQVPVLWRVVGLRSWRKRCES